MNETKRLSAGRRRNRSTRESYADIFLRRTRKCHLPRSTLHTTRDSGMSKNTAPSFFRRSIYIELYERPAHNAPFRLHPTKVPRLFPRLEQKRVARAVYFASPFRRRCTAPTGVVSLSSPDASSTTRARHHTNERSSLLSSSPSATACPPLMKRDDGQ